MRDLQSLSIYRDYSSNGEVTGNEAGATWVWIAEYARPTGTETGRLYASAGASREDLVAALPPRLREAAAVLGFAIDFGPVDDVADGLAAAPLYAF